MIRLLIYLLAIIGARTLFQNRHRVVEVVEDIAEKAEDLKKKFDDGKVVNEYEVRWDRDTETGYNDVGN